MYIQILSIESKYYNSAQVACKAILAGVDILLCPENVQEAISTLQSAVADGIISEERINESVRRILTVKINRKIIEI